MLEMVKLFHEAFHTESTWAFVVPIAVLFAVMSGSVAFMLDKSYKNTLSKDGSVTQELEKRIARDDDEIARMRGELDQRAKHEQERAAIGAFIEQGGSIMSECLSAEIKLGLTDRANAWANKTREYLLKVDSSYAARFNTATGVTFAHAGVPQANESVWNFVNQRNQALNAILQELRD